jgi:hypothetical protein
MITPFLIAYHWSFCIIAEHFGAHENDRVCVSITGAPEIAYYKQRFGKQRSGFVVESLHEKPNFSSLRFGLDGRVQRAHLSKRMKTKCPRVVMLTSRIQTMTAIDSLELLNQNVIGFSCNRSSSFAFSQSDVLLRDCSATTSSIVFRRIEKQSVDLACCLQVVSREPWNAACEQGNLITRTKKEKES